MILNILLLFGLVSNEISCLYSNVTEGPQEDDNKELRIGETNKMEKRNNMVKIIFFKDTDDQGTVVPDTGYQDVIGLINKSKKTVLMFNGHPTGDSTAPFKALRDALFQTQDVNIFYVFVDWTEHKITFMDALAYSDALGQDVKSRFLKFDIDISKLHFIGHCVGAEIGSSVAKEIKNSKGLKIPRLTVFDPFISNTTMLNDAQEYFDFVDAYHAGLYDPPFSPIGTVDFYPNAGTVQPGCEQNDILEQSICHHQRSINLYVESLYTQVQAIEVDFSLSQMHLTLQDLPKTVTFGYMVDLNQFGAYYLPTRGTQPYLMDYF